MWTWGAGGFGELGHGDDTDSAVPRLVRLGVRFRHVSCGFYHTAAVSEDGGVWTWGWGRDGQLGHSEEPSGKPARVLALRDVSAHRVSCGHSFTLALGASGAVFLWGLVDGGPGSTQSPTRDDERGMRQLRLHLPARQLAAGGRHVALTLEDGSLWTLGSNSHGQLGHASAGSISQPARVGALDGVFSVSCGEDHSVAVALAAAGGGAAAAGVGVCGDGGTNQPAVWVWGRCEYTGREARDGGHAVPRPLPWMDDVGSPSTAAEALSCGYYHSVRILGLCHSAIGDPSPFGNPLGAPSHPTLPPRSAPLPAAPSLLHRSHPAQPLLTAPLSALMAASIGLHPGFQPPTPSDPPPHPPRPPAFPPGLHPCLWSPSHSDAAPRTPCPAVPPGLHPRFWSPGDLVCSRPGRRASHLGTASPWRPYHHRGLRRLRHRHAGHSRARHHRPGVVGLRSFPALRLACCRPAQRIGADRRLLAQLWLLQLLCAGGGSRGRCHQPLGLWPRHTSLVRCRMRLPAAGG